MANTHFFQPTSPEGSLNVESGGDASEEDDDADEFGKKLKIKLSRRGNKIFRVSSLNLPFYNDGCSLSW